MYDNEIVWSYLHWWSLLDFILRYKGKNAWILFILSNYIMALLNHMSHLKCFLQKIEIHSTTTDNLKMQKIEMLSL